MPLLSPADQDKLRTAFDEMTSPVRVLFFTQTLDCETCLQARQILDELPPLSDKITIEEVNFVLDKDKAAQYGIDRVPALALVGAEQRPRLADPIPGRAVRLRVHLARPGGSAGGREEHESDRRKTSRASPASTSR